jgi:glycosyltransferase involved in cell wall biosynthesis
VVFVSDQVRDRFARFVPETRTSVINNGVDLTRFEPGDESPSPDSGRALMPNAPTLLFVGRFVEKKGIDQIRAVARERPDWRWLLIGRGDHEDPSGWGLENVVCLPPVPRSKLASVYRNANLLILPSTGEGLPVVIQEAILSGLGVVTTTDTAAAIPRECSPAVTAWDSRCGPLTEAIQRALERPRVDVDTIAAARRLWGIERVAERYEEIFQAEL